MAIYRPATGSCSWCVLLGDYSYAQTNLRSPGDVPVRGYYDGSTKADLAVYRPGTSNCYIRHTTRTPA